MEHGKRWLIGKDRPVNVIGRGRPMDIRFWSKLLID
jgi:hypothetical protein